MFCTKCGNHTEDNYIYCTYCGNKLEKAEEVEEVKVQEKVEVKNIYISIIGIIVAELTMFYSNLFYGLIIHIINIMGIIFILIFSNLDTKIKNILQALTLIILLRLINYSMPQFFNVTILQYLLIYGIMFMPIYSIIRSQQMTIKDLGLTIDKKLLIYLPLAIIIGLAMAIIEYNILRPISFFKNINFSDIIVIAVIMIFFIGTVEELIFRSILQTRLEKVFGVRSGILLSGGLFGIEHMSYGLIGEIIFAGIVGIILGYIFQKTKNLIFIASIHGIENTILFGILPISPNIINMIINIINMK